MATPRVSKKKTSKKKASSPRKLVDDVLVKVSPQMQKRMDQLIETLQSTKEARIGDLKWLGGQILLRSREVSRQLQSLRSQAPKKTSSKKVSSKKTKK